MKPNRFGLALSPRRFATALLFCLASIPAGELVAQAPSQPPPFASQFRCVWVDPDTGSDSTGGIGNPAAPYHTINAAITALSLSNPQLAPGSLDGIVYLQPGVYSWSTNQEVLPVKMRHGIHLLGVGDARETIIRGEDNGQYQGVNVFLPNVAGNNNGVRPLLSNVLVRVLLSSITRAATNDNANYETLVNGVTFEGGQVQVYIETERYAKRFRVSNCLFDLRERPEVVTGTMFGVLMVDTRFAGDYADFRVSLLHSTFVQGEWRPGQSDPPRTAAMGNVAICDTCDPIGDPVTTLRGVGRHNVQNNLIRCLPDNPRTAMLGLARNDTSVIEGGVLGGRQIDTNVFVPRVGNLVTVGGANISGGTNHQFFSSMSPVPPNPPTPPQPALPLYDGTQNKDILFVGEAITANDPSHVLSGSGPRDWRLMHASPFRDAGVAPTPWTTTTGITYQTLTAANETSNLANCTTYYERTGTGWPLATFLNDGEGFGNARIADAAPDPGFDEIQTYISAGFRDGTREHNQIANTTQVGSLPLAATTRRNMLFPAGTTATAPLITVFETTASYVMAPATRPGWAIPVNPPAPYGRPIPPGSAVNNVPPSGSTLFVPRNPAPPVVYWPGCTGPGACPVPQLLWFSPVDSGFYPVGNIAFDATETGPATYLNRQVLYQPSNGTARFYTNLQREIF